MCDLTYVLQLERIERRVLTERQVVMQAIACGVDMDLPTVQEAWDEFDEALSDTTTQARASTDPVRDDLLQALGIRR